MGHVWYIVGFSLNQSLRLLHSLPFVLLGAGLFTFLKPHVKPDLVIPVLVRSRPS